MKCPTHQAEATGICVYCGRGMCAQCAPPIKSRRQVCSEECAGALARADQATALLVQKSLQNTRASAFYAYLCAALSGGAALGAYHYMPVPFLIWFTVGCTAVFLLSALWYTRIARKQNPPRP